MAVVITFSVMADLIPAQPASKSSKRLWAKMQNHPSSRLELEEESDKRECAREMLSAYLANHPDIPQEALLERLSLLVPDVAALLRGDG